MMTKFLIMNQTMATILPQKSTKMVPCEQAIK